MIRAGRRLRAALAGLAAILATAAPGPVQARLGPVIASYGKWNLRRDTDLLSDRVTCLATYQGNRGIQLFRDALYLKFSEGPRSYRYRIDDEPISPAIPATPADWHSRTIALKGAAFNRLVAAHRLRLQVVTRRFSVMHVAEFDVDLDGIYSAYGAIYYCR